jgi:hypothetical protein
VEIYESTENTLNEPVCFLEYVLVLHKDVMEGSRIGDVKLLILQSRTSANLYHLRVIRLTPNAPKIVATPPYWSTRFWWKAHDWVLKICLKLPATIRQ